MCQFLDFIAGGMLFFWVNHGTKQKDVTAAEEGNIQREE